MRRSAGPVHTLASRASDDVDGHLHGCVSDELYLAAIRACAAGGALARARAVVDDAELCGVCTPELCAAAVDAIERGGGAGGRAALRDELCRELRARGGG